MTIFVDQKIADAYGIKDDNELCQCGGFRKVVHCPDCGSTQCYGNKRASPSVILPGANTTTTVRAFRCKLCTRLFDESDCMKACKAKTRFREKAMREERTTEAAKRLQPDVAKSLAEEIRKRVAQRQVEKDRLTHPDLGDPREEAMRKATEDV